MNDLVLLADKNNSAWDFAKKISNYIKDTKEKEVHICPLEIKKFRDGEILPHVPENIRKKDVYLIQSSNKDPNQWLAELILIKNLCLSADVNSLSFVLPDMRYSRQDRKHMSRVPISTRAVADAISPGLKRIITMDLHSPQIQNAYPPNVPLDNLGSFPEAVKYFREVHGKDLENLVVVSPDVGGGNRADSFRENLARKDIELNIPERDYPIIIISKMRDKKGNIEKMFLSGDVNDKNAIIIDDIYDSGGTMIKAAKLLKDNGAKKLFAYATHGLFTEGTAKISRAFDSVMTSNTFYSPKSKNSKIEVIDMTPTFAEAIYRAQDGLSVSKLFE